MRTLYAADKTAIHLGIGDTLTVAGDATADGTIYKCTDESGTGSSASYDIANSSSLVLGPFNEVTTFLILCTVGEVTTVVAKAAVALAANPLALLGLTLAEGDIIYVDADGALAVLPIGEDDDVMTVADGLPAWVTPA